MSKQIFLEKRVRFSKSILWELQRDYFSSQGVNAWVNQVPYYVTSNCFIANVYANIAIRLVQDCVKQNPNAAQQPFYVLEMGTGPGKFSYYVMRRMFELQKSLGLEEVPIVYIMTDFTDSNVQYWETHPSLEPYLQQGKLDFAIFNLENTRELHLINANKTLSKGSCSNPIIAFANYIFDTVSDDAFHVEKGKIQEAVVRTACDPQNMRGKKPINLEMLDVGFDYHNLGDGPYYTDPHLNTVLMNYASLLTNTSFLIPIGGIVGVKALMEIANNQLLLISTDKGYTELFELDNLSDPRVVFHGSFSMMVNFHAIGEYFKQCGGDVMHQTPRRGIKTSVFIAGRKFEDLPETWQAINHFVEDFGPADFFNFHEYIKANIETVDLKTLASHMNLNRWDPHIFRLAAKRINEDILNQEPAVLQAFIQGMPKIADNFYYMPNNVDTFFEIAVFFHTIHMYHEALPYYHKSIHYFGVQYSTHYNIALCHYFSGEPVEALRNFKEAQAMEPESTETNDWVTRIENELAGNGETKVE